MTPKRRKTDKLPPDWAREVRLQELCNQQHEELLLVKAESARLRRAAAWINSEMATRPAELTQ